MRILSDILAYVAHVLVSRRLLPENCQLVRQCLNVLLELLFPSLGRIIILLGLQSNGRLVRCRIEQQRSGTCKEVQLGCIQDDEWCGQQVKASEFTFRTKKQAHKKKSAAAINRRTRKGLHSKNVYSSNQSPNKEGLPHKVRLDNFLWLIGVADVEDCAMPRAFDSHARLVDQGPTRQIC